MKKVIFAMSILVGSMLLAACGNNKCQEDACATEAVETVTENVAEPQPEEALEPTDTSSAVTRGGATTEGFRRCSKCACREFEGRGHVCKNCGHAYRAHY